MRRCRDTAETASRQRPASVATVSSKPRITCFALRSPCTAAGGLSSIAVGRHHRRCDASPLCGLAAGVGLWAYCSSAAAMPASSVLAQRSALS
jgi:hypothetical protein